MITCSIGTTYGLTKMDTHFMVNLHFLFELLRSSFNDHGDTFQFVSFLRRRPIYYSTLPDFHINVNNRSFNNKLKNVKKIKKNNKIKKNKNLIFTNILLKIN